MANAIRTYYLIKMMDEFVYEFISISLLVLLLAQKQFNRCHHEYISKCKYALLIESLHHLCEYDELLWHVMCIHCQGSTKCRQFIEPNTSVEGVNCEKIQEYYCTVSPLKFTSRKPIIPFICHLIIFHMRHKHTSTNEQIHMNCYRIQFYYLSLNLHIYIYTQTHTHAWALCVLIYWKNVISREKK